MTSGTSLQHHLSFLPGVTLLIFEGTRASCKPLAPRLSTPRSHGRSPGTPTMFGVIIGRDVGLCGPLRLRKDPPHQGNPQTCWGSDDAPRIWLLADTSVRVGLSPPLLIGAPERLEEQGRHTGGAGTAPATGMNTEQRICSNRHDRPPHIDMVCHLKKMSLPLPHEHLPLGLTLHLCQVCVCGVGGSSGGWYLRPTGGCQGPG